MNLEGTAKSVPSFLCGTQAALILSCTGSLLVLFDILKHFVYSIILLNFLSRRIFTAYLLRLICRIRDVIIRPFLLLQFHVICGYNPFRITYAVFSLLCCLIFFCWWFLGFFWCFTCYTLQFHRKAAFQSKLKSLTRLHVNCCCASLSHNHNVFNYSITSVEFRAEHHRQWQSREIWY